MDRISLVLDQLEALRSDPFNFSYPQYLLERWKALTNDLAASYEQRRYNFEQRQTDFAQRQAFFEQQQIWFEQQRSRFEQHQAEWQAHCRLSQQQDSTLSGEPAVPEE